MNGDRDVFRRQEFGQTIGFGHRPGLLIIDFTVGFRDPATFGGGNIGTAIEHTIPLLEDARTAAIPIAHTQIIYADDGSDTNLHSLKVPRLKALTESNPLSQFVPELRPHRGEIVIKKRLPSAFFGTDLAAILMARGVDTLIIAGCTTSGCVRASAVDAICLGFRPMVVPECVGDRAQSAHEASLFDLSQKYADLVALDEARDRLRTASPIDA